MKEIQGYYTCEVCKRKNCYGNPDVPICFSCSSDEGYIKGGQLTGAGATDYYRCPQRVRVIPDHEVRSFIAQMPGDRNIWWDVLHNSASPIKHYHGLSTWKSFQDYHMYSRGWRDIGYHFGIGPDGLIFLGRAITITGAHAFTQGNRGSIGICMIGNFDSEDPTPIQIQKFNWLATSLGKHFGYHGKVNAYLKGIHTTEHSGHRWADWHPTSCPGMRVSWEKLQGWIRSEPQPPKPKSREDTVLYQGEGKTFVFEDCYVGRYTYWLHTRGDSKNVQFKLLSHRTGKEKPSEYQTVKGHQDHDMQAVAANPKTKTDGSYTLICTADSSIKWALREVPKN